MKSANQLLKLSILESKENKLVRKVARYINDILTNVHNVCSKYEYLCKDVDGTEDVCKYNELPPLVVIMGEFKSGKSTFINNLLGIDILKTDITPTTAAVTLLRYSISSKIILHKIDGTKEEYELGMLPKLSAEGNDDYIELRKSIYYIEVFLPVNLLKYITIVDTPGLNSINQYHTQATKNFIDNANLVLWLFSSTNAGTRSEIGIIEGIAKTTKIIGIINRIDEHDPEEEDLDEFIDIVHRKMQKSISKMVGVSSLQAHKAFSNKDSQLFEESRWIEVLELLNEELIENGAEIKAESMISRLGERIDKIAKHYRHYAQQYKEMTHLKETIRKLNEERDLWKQLHAEHKPLTQFLEYAERPLPTAIQNYSMLQRKMRVLYNMCQQLDKERSELKTKKRQLDLDLLPQQQDEEMHEREVDAFNKNSKGHKTKSEIQAMEQIINNRAALLAEEMAVLARSYSTLDNQMKNIVDEILVFGKTISDAIERTLQNLNDSMNRKTNDQMDQTIAWLEWTNEFKRDILRLSRRLNKNILKIQQQIMKTKFYRKEELINILNRLMMYLRG